jgi:2-keto-4-pentenoate hydratase/2-oxohepta-3-ene-1,7-dioic acid hydratase in catechol pathway
MNYATVLKDGRRLVASIDAQRQIASPLLDAAGREYGDMLEVIRVSVAPNPLEFATGASWPLKSVVLVAPIPLPHRNIFCIGKNYREHIREVAQALPPPGARPAADAAPEDPIVFTKMPQTVIGPDAPIRYPEGLSEQLDYEAELGVVIGAPGRGIAASAALKHVFGYTILNDVTVRDWQTRHKQWFLGKSFDTFCPMGPWIVSAEQIDIANTAVRCWVNGELRQDGNTSDMIFGIPRLIETISAGIGLLPGDVIATGTPAGVGLGFKPPKFLRRGDVVSIEIGGIGRLINPVA